MRGACWSASAATAGALPPEAPSRLKRLEGGVAGLAEQSGQTLCQQLAAARVSAEQVGLELTRRGVPQAIHGLDLGIAQVRIERRIEQHQPANQVGPQVGQRQGNQGSERVADHGDGRLEPVFSFDELDQVVGVVGGRVARRRRIALAMAAQVRCDGGQVGQQAACEGLPDAAADAQAVEEQDWRRRRIDDVADVKPHACAGAGVFTPLHV